MEERYRTVVMHDTWGHLFPDKTQYIGKVRIAIPLYGGQCGIIDEKDLPGASPWWHTAISTFAFDVGNTISNGEVVEFDIQVDIVDREEFNEDNEEDDTWTEIHIKQLARTTLIEAW